MFRILIICCTLLIGKALVAQETFPVNGVQDTRNTTYAFVHATIHTSPGNVLEDATLIIRNDVILAVGRQAAIPADAVLRDLNGLHIYPAFIELSSNYGIPEKPRMKGGSGPQYETMDTRAANWNQAVTPEYNAFDDFSTDTAMARQLRSIGFGAVLAHRTDGIVRGTSALVQLTAGPPHEAMLMAAAGKHFSFSKGSSGQSYPSSQMGVIALLRQTFYDGAWYAAGGRDVNFDLSLQAMNQHPQLPLFMHVDSKLEVLRAARLGAEFNQTFIVENDGDAYQRLDEIKASGSKLILPLNFPDVPDVADAWDAAVLPLSTLKHWEMAPANPAMVAAAGIPFAITSNRLTKKKDFLDQLRKAVAYGLSQDAALASLTTVPAAIVGATSMLGTLEKGKKANFFISSDNIFLQGADIYESWVNGQPMQVQPYLVNDPRGAYSLHMSDTVYGLLISGEPCKPTFSIVREPDTIKATGNINYDNVSISFTLQDNLYRLSGILQGSGFVGTGTKGTQRITWNAEKVNVYAAKAETPSADTLLLGSLIYPFTAYGQKTLPEAKDYLITNATVWTNEADGILEGYDVLVKNGKIAQVGKGLKADGATVIDGTGKHLTAGIIDEHSHIAINKGVNEGTQAITSEVRIGDVVDSEDVNIYRQLAGGVTTSHLLHGSANPIGGQTALIKLRWGMAPEAMKFENADGFIKFALGENVKQSNWGDENRIRYPQTRMGVEQIMEDGFVRATAYKAALARKDTLVRRDLELDALVEIMEAKRFITCHSYVQSEINMLMKLAERHGFTVNTFTHILEGYKVADKMAQHGAGASTFSDWWAYKYEVIEAIPFNAALLTQMGVVTAINSDDAEMARRLNQEAAKAVKYGNLSEEEAWKLVTINPARLLHIDDRVGSIKKGKDADLVLWSDRPLSIYARAEMTFVDGMLLYDLEADQQLQREIAEEKARLTAAIIEAKKKGAKVAPVVIREEPEYECETVFDFVGE